MKKMILTLILLLGVLLTGCSNEFAKTEYDNNKLLAETADRYSKSMAVMNYYENHLTFTAGSFDGRQKLWSESYESDSNVLISLKFTLGSGTAKIVHIDSDNNVEVIAECDGGKTNDDAVVYNIAMSKGENRIKIVGYECKELNVDMQING